jgi:hypothetical protein
MLAAGARPSTHLAWSPLWRRFETEVVEPGNCTHCGACAGLAGGLIEFRETAREPLPFSTRQLTEVGDAPLALGWAVCPGRGVPCPELFQSGSSGWAYLSEKTRQVPQRRDKDLRTGLIAPPGAHDPARPLRRGRL